MTQAIDNKKISGNAVIQLTLFIMVDFLGSWSWRS
jgi:hypothetical protein